MALGLDGVFGPLNGLAGLPAHPLFAHLAVVAIPIAALLTVVVAVFPRVPPLVKLTALVSGALSVVIVPLMESSGEALEHRVRETAAVENHAEMGETLLPWATGLFVVIVAVLATDWWLRRPICGAQAAPRSRAVRRILRIGLAVVAIAMSTGTFVQTVRIGHSGSRATWSTPSTSTPGAPPEGDSEEDEH